MKRNSQGIEIEVVSGDIANQADVECVVNAANALLRPGGGVAGAVHRSAGPGLYEECRPLAPIEPGEAVITGAHDLPNRYVIHCLGPIYGRDYPEAELLANCYRNALCLAEEKGIRSIAFPSISTGVFGYPLQEAARIALKTVVEESSGLNSLEKVRFVLFGDEALSIHQQALAEVAGDRKDRAPGK